MGIWVYTQDRKGLVQTNGIVIKSHQDYTKRTYSIESISPVATLGVYGTEERAKEVLDMLKNVAHKPNFVVDMPER